MSLDISIHIHEKAKCPHCGGTVKGEIVREIDTGGRCYDPLLDEIKYDGYGGYMTLDDEQIKAVIAAFMEHGDDNAAGHLAYAMIADRIVEFEADW